MQGGTEPQGIFALTELAVAFWGALIALALQVGPLLMRLLRGPSVSLHAKEPIAFTFQPLGMLVEIPLVLSCEGKSAFIQSIGLRIRNTETNEEHGLEGLEVLEYRPTDHFSGLLMRPSFKDFFSPFTLEEGKSAKLIVRFADAVVRGKAFNLITQNLVNFEAFQAQNAALADEQAREAFHRTPVSLECWKQFGELLYLRAGSYRATIECALRKGKSSIEFDFSVVPFQQKSLETNAFRMSRIPKPDVPVTYNYAYPGVRLGPPARA